MWGVMLDLAYEVVLLVLIRLGGSVMQFRDCLINGELVGVQNGRHNQYVFTSACTNTHYTPKGVFVPILYF